MLLGVNDISTCPIQMATSCRSRIRSSDLAVFRWPHGLIWSEQLLAKVYVQHPLAHVLSRRWSRNETKFGLGLGLKERFRRTPASPLRSTAAPPESADELPRGSEAVVQMVGKIKGRRSLQGKKRQCSG
jgi:hypothetical protein